MLNINKSLRKLGIISVSALTLLGIGVGISSTNTNTHAAQKSVYAYSMQGYKLRGTTHRQAEDAVAKATKYNSQQYKINDQSKQMHLMLLNHAIKTSHPNQMTHHKNNSHIIQLGSYRARRGYRKSYRRYRYNHYRNKARHYRHRTIKKYSRHKARHIRQRHNYRHIRKHGYKKVKKFVKRHYIKRHHTKNIKNRLIKKYFTSNEQSQINNYKQRLHYLQKYENQSNSDSNEATPTFRHNEVDWINFYRSMFGLSPVSESSSFDHVAQQGADTQEDPEDMNWGDDNPGDCVQSYFTDENDADNDGTTGHRDSILNPQATNVGIGQKNDINALYFDWGINNGASSNYKTNITYPTSTVFPISDAQDAQYWSCQFNNDPYDSDNNISSPNISVHDDASNNEVNVSHITTTDREVYYAVNTDALKPYHQYTITFSGDGIPNGSYSYTTKLYNLD